MKPIQKTQGKMKKPIWVTLTLFGALYGAILLIGSVAFFVRQSEDAVSKETYLFPIKEQANDTAQFPVGVDVKKEEIVESPIVETYFQEHVLSKTNTSGTHVGWLPRIMGKLALMNWYQNLASLSSRVLIIQSGERKEQVADNFGKILKWNAEQKAEFLTLIESSAPELSDGKFFPGNYTVAKSATPSDVAPLILDKFNAEVMNRYGVAVEEKVPLGDALTVASLLEREAYDFEDMRLISGVIWNRLFTDMRLQIDATLQYAKGSTPSQPWWPKVAPSDKYIASVYNTYKNEGLPPTPIANPSLEAILAALNPKKTDCMYYFHDKKAGFHCSKTYEEHVQLLKEYYGRGK